MPLSVGLSTLSVGALVMLWLSLHFWGEDLPVWSHFYAVMAGISIGVVFIGAVFSLEAVLVAYA